jgi:hypothetical protein
VLPDPLSPPEAKRLIIEILRTGTVSFSSHARQEMAKDGLTAVEVVNVLRGGVVEPPEWEHGSWRYRARSGRITVVIVFRSALTLVVVTAWRSAR